VSCDCQGPLPVDPLVSRSPISRSREAGAVGLTGPTGTVANMAAPSGPWAAIVTQEICPGCTPPILSAGFNLGYVTSTTYRHGAIELWTAANDFLSVGAWVRVVVDSSLAVSAGTGGGPSFLSSATGPVEESTAPAFASRLVRTLRSASGGPAVKVSGGCGSDPPIFEAWCIEQAETPLIVQGPNITNRSFSVIFAEIGTGSITANTPTRVGSVLNWQSSEPAGQPPFVTVGDRSATIGAWNGATFAFEVPTSQILDSATDVEFLRQGIKCEPATVPTLPTGVLPVQASVSASLSESLQDGKTSVRFPTGPAFNDWCSIPDGAFWHEQAIIRQGPLAVEGMLHKVTAKFSDPFVFSDSHPSTFGARFIQGGFGSFDTGFFHDTSLNPAFFNFKYISGIDVDFLPTINGKRLLPRSYVSGPIQGPLLTFSEINNQGILGPADYDVTPVFHCWFTTSRENQGGFVDALFCTFTIQWYLIWNIRATTGGWTGNRRYVRHYPTRIRQIVLTQAQCNQLADGGKVTATIRIPSEFGGFAFDPNPASVELSVSEYVP
jgi:hypothetical protein